MRPGDFILNQLQEAPAGARTIALIRHAERDSFEGVPHNLRKGAEITPEGMVMARRFGASLGKSFPGKHLALGHTFATRCRMTAESIRDGYSPGTRAHILGCEPELEHPVINLENFIALENRLGWNTLFCKWMEQEIPEDTLRNSHQYTAEILRQLVAFPGACGQDLLMVVVHDITLFPLIFSIFRKKVDAVEFLNGIVLTVEGNSVGIRFSNAEFSLKAELAVE